MTFLKAILNGSKKALGLRKVIYVNFPRLKPFSVQKVLRLALENEEIKKYLPEKEEIDGFYINRRYLFAIVNTLDPTFFQRALDDYTAAGQK